MMEILLTIAGLALILVGANYLTDGSAALARRFHISEFIVGLTVVAIGTSTPELIVSVMSALANSEVPIFSAAIFAPLIDLVSIDTR